MISGGSRGSGGPRLARHLLDAELNERVVVGRGRGLASTQLHQQLKELSAMSAHGRTGRPLWHLHADPAQPWTPENWAAYWSDLETEFSLTGQPFAEATHIKGGRLHVHRVYSLVELNGRLVDLRHDYARREKISRIAEHRTGEPLTAGRHNRSVANALTKDGRADVVEAMAKAGLLTVARPAAMTPMERHIADRQDTDLQTLRSEVWQIWQTHKSAVDFQSKIEAHGYQLAKGEKTVVIIDRTGNVHSLDRLIGAGAKIAGAIRPAAASIRARVYELPLPAIGPKAAIGVPSQARSPTTTHAPSTLPLVVRPAIPRPLDRPGLPTGHPDRSPQSAQRSTTNQKEDKVAYETQPISDVPMTNSIGPADSSVLTSTGLDVTALMLLASWSQVKSKLWLLNLVLRVERYTDCYALVLTTSQRLAIQTNRVTHFGEPTEDSAAMLVEVAKAKGWNGIQLQGDDAFKEAVVRAAVKAGMPIANPELAIMVARFRKELEMPAVISHPAWPPVGAFLNPDKSAEQADGEGEKTAVVSDRRAIAMEFVQAARARRNEADPIILKTFGLRMREIAAAAVEGGYASEIETLIEATAKPDERSYISNAWRDRAETAHGMALSEGRIPSPANQDLNSPAEPKA